MQPTPRQDARRPATDGAYVRADAETAGRKFSAAPPSSNGGWAWVGKLPTAARIDPLIAMYQTGARPENLAARLGWAPSVGFARVEFVHREAVNDWGWS